MTYDETVSTNQVNWWLGNPGFALRSGNFSVSSGSLAGQGNYFFIGNNTNYNAGFRNGASDPGLIDEFAIWKNVHLTGSQITNQFSALSVSSGPAPILSVSADGGNVILSWPTASTGYSLYSNTNLATANWVTAGAASVVGANYVVTNATTGDAKFYRLQK
jgi:hypothetical protein